MHSRFLLTVLISLIAVLTALSQTRVPTIDDLLNVKSLGGARISPDGDWVAYTFNETDWKQDAFVTHIWLVNTTGGKPFQLTRGEKSAANPQWSPDGEWLTFTSNRVGDKNQIFAIRVAGGEAAQLTKSENGVGGYQWSRDGKQIAYTSSDLDAKAAKERTDYLGGFEVTRKEYTFTQIWTLEVAKALTEPIAGTQRTKAKDYTVGSFEWSPDGTQITFSATVNSDLINGS
ncbi:MAG: S9 family peptidase, partial [Pyrinomonadaceae bacterium]